MTSFKVSTIINRSPDIVVEALMNADNWPHWTTDLEKFEVIERRPGEVGSIGHLHYRQKGRSYMMEDKLLSCEPGERYLSRVSGDFLTAYVETTLHILDQGTELSIAWSGKGKVLSLRIMLPLLRGKMIKQAQAELETFKRLVETRGSNFSKSNNEKNE